VAKAPRPGRARTAAQRGRSKSWGYSCVGSWAPPSSVLAAIAGFSCKGGGNHAPRSRGPGFPQYWTELHAGAAAVAPESSRGTAWRSTSARAGSGRHAAAPAAGFGQVIKVADPPPGPTRPLVQHKAELMGHYSIALIVARVILAHRAISRRSAVISAERPPWIVRAWRIRSIPSAVRGPVLSPP